MRPQERIFSRSRQTTPSTRCLISNYAIFFKWRAGQSGAISEREAHFSSPVKFRRVRMRRSDKPGRLQLGLTLSFPPQEKRRPRCVLSHKAPKLPRYPRYRILLSQDSVFTEQ